MSLPMLFSAQAQTIEPELPAPDEIIDVSAAGTVTSVTQGEVPFDSSVQVGNPVFFDFAIDIATTTPEFGIFNTDYVSDSGSGSLIIGDYSLSEPISNNYDIGDSGSIPSSGNIAGSIFYAGYVFESSYPSNNGFANGLGLISLFSTTLPAVSIEQYPLEDFDWSRNMELEESPTYGTPSTVYAEVTSYTVTTTIVPEPPVWALFLGGLCLLAWCSRSGRTFS